jgi:hypothetical protein
MGMLKISWIEIDTWILGFLGFKIGTYRQPQWKNP